jgi:glycosyltransferase involved in cell wall biosynthesis
MSSNPSVLMFCPNFRPVVGGAERQAERLATVLATEGCRVRVLTPRHGATSLAFEALNGFEVRRFDFVDLAKKYPKIPMVGVVNLANLVRSMRRAVRAHIDTFDVLHVHLVGTSGAVAVGVAAEFGYPVVCKVGSSGQGSDFFTAAGNAAVLRWVRGTYRTHVDRWIATSLAVQESIVDAGNASERVVRIPNGVEIPGQSRCYRDAAGKRFLYVGRVSRETHRDFETLVSAFGRLATSVGDVELALVGKGNQVELLRQAVTQAGLGDRVHFPGECRPDEWYAWADCFVLPSRREGMSNALLEAMAAGLPCIANDIPPNREVLDHGRAGFLVPVGDLEALLAVMRRIEREQGLAECYGALAFERAKTQYSIDSVGMRHIELYKDVVQRSRRRK